MTSLATNLRQRSSVFSAAAAIMLRTFVCNIGEADAADRAMDALCANKDVDVGLEDLGLEPVEFVRDTLTASDVETIVVKAATDIESLLTGQDTAGAALHCALAGLLEQIDLLGIADWHGAEGVALADARCVVLLHRHLAKDPLAIENHHGTRHAGDLERELTPA